MTKNDSAVALADTDTANHAQQDRRVKDLIKDQRVIHMPPTTSVGQACEVMAMLEMGALPIMNEGRLAGNFMERNALKRVLARDRDPENTAVSDVMSAVMCTAVCTIDSTAKFGDALTLMRENGLRHLPVVDGKDITGIVTVRDLLN